MSVNSTLAHAAYHLTAMKEIKDAIEKDMFKHARKRAMDALQYEINFASNDARSKSVIYGFLGEINEKEENWEDAIGNLRQAWALEGSLRQGGLDFKATFLRTSHLTRLKGLKTSRQSV